MNVGERLRVGRSHPRYAVGNPTQETRALTASNPTAIVLNAALALMVVSTAHAAVCKRGEPQCGVPRILRAG
jgi:hypothetical protein